MPLKERKYLITGKKSKEEMSICYHKFLAIHRALSLMVRGTQLI